MSTFRQAALAVLIGVITLHLSDAAEVVVTAGANPTDIQPIQVTTNQNDIWSPLVEGSWKLVNGDENVPLQLIRRDMPSYNFRMDGGKTVLTGTPNQVYELFFVVKGLKPYEQRVYQIESADSSEPYVSLDRNDSKIVVTAGGKPFTEYRYEVSDEMPRPAMYPVYGPEGASMTRGHPLVEAKPSEKQDHPHHHSLWVSHGDVNKVNFWHLGKEQGYQRHDSFSSVESGPVVGRIEVVLNWEDEKGNHVLSERRAMTFWAPSDDMRYIDIDSTLIADTGDVVFGDTKEGGLISLRVAGTMKEESELGGVITNSNGLVGEKEAWGKAAPWCDYSGPVDGVQAGITIMDNPDNPFYPTYYHVRNYGLFTANPFGLSYFTGDKNNVGSKTLKHGSTWRNQYRVYIHPGDVKSGNVAGQYDAYVNEPRVVLR
jgi:hypothetical protein